MDEPDLRKLLSEGLDLCVRARRMDGIARREATLSASSDAEGWQASGAFDRYVARHNITHPDEHIATRSGTLALWMQEQYDCDLADWEIRARKALSEGNP